MKSLPIAMFLFILAIALCSSMCSYHSAERRIDEDVNNALELTLAQMPCDAISADTIRCYCKNLTIFIMEFHYIFKLDNSIIFYLSSNTYFIYFHHSIIVENIKLILILLTNINIYNRLLKKPISFIITNKYPS